MRQGQGAKIFSMLWPKPHHGGAAALGSHPLDLAPPLGPQAPLAGGGAPLLGSDWLWRPDLFTRKNGAIDCRNPAQRRELGADLVLYHDADRLDLTLGQGAQHGDILPPFGLVLDCAAFEGSFLSFSLSLPREVVRGLELRHLIRMDLLAEFTPRESAEMTAFARLNVRHGPNVAQLVCELTLRGGAGAVALAEFDLAYGAISERRIEALWLDLIFDAPAAGRVVLQDLTLSRCPRAAL